MRSSIFDLLKTGFDSSTVDIGGLRRAYDQVIATGAESSSPTCRRLCTIAKAVLVVREAVAVGDWSDKSDKKNQRFNERTGKYDSVQKSSVVSITAALNQAQQILGSVGGVTEGALVAVGIPQAVLDTCRSSSKINGKDRVEFIPTDEMNFIKSERDDYEMVSISKAKESVHRVYGKHCSYRYSVLFDLVPLLMSFIES